MIINKLNASLLFVAGLSLLAGCSSDARFHEI